MIMNRRNFLKLSGILLTSPNLLLANNSQQIKISMNGDLDDDLFVMSSKSFDWKFIDCYQMHNPTDVFLLEGRKTISIHSPGYIEYNKNITIDNDEVIMIALANEREEKDPSKSLIERTHYKSVSLYINDKELIPSMNPDTLDLPDVPTWFSITSPKSVYNYYRAWENAIVNLGLVVNKSGKYTISLSDSQDTIVASDSFEIDNNTKNIRFKESILGKIDEHTMSEIDGSVFLVEDKKQPDDEKIRTHCPRSILIEDEKGNINRIPFPYPFPYINRLYMKSLN